MGIHGHKNSVELKGKSIMRRLKAHYGLLRKLNQRSRAQFFA